MGARDENPETGERRGERMTLDEATRLRPNDWSSLEVRMIDLSSGGFRARCEARLQRGSCVSLDIPGVGAVDAQVEWQRGDMFGARFFQPIELASSTWTPSERVSVLAQLLIERAAARRAGRGEAESGLRQRILATLPISKGSASA
jgi:hypothetical protein